MVNSLKVIVGLLFGIMTAHGQDINEPEVDSMRVVLTRSIPDTDRLDILFRLAEFYLQKPGDLKQDLNEAEGFLKKTEQLNSRLKSTDAKGFQVIIASLFARERKQEQEGKKLAANALTILGNSRNKYYLGKAYFNLSDFYHYTNREELVEKIRLVELAVQCFAQSKYVVIYANSVKHLADLYEINEQRSKVLENLNLSLKLYQSVNYPKLCGVYVLYNRYYYLGGNYKLALDYCLLALRNAESTGDSSMLYCQINNYMAITLVHLKERMHAVDYFKIAMRIAEKYRDNAAVLMVMNNMVRNYIELKKPEVALDLMKSIPKQLLVPVSEEGYILSSLCYASIYFELKRYPETGLYCNQIMDLMKVHMPRAQVVNDFYYLLIRYYLETKQYAPARIFYKKIDSLSRKIGDPTRIKDNFYLAFRLDTATGSYKPAIAELLKFQHLHDSLFDETNSRQMQQLEVEYETQKTRNEIMIKDKDIVLLNQKYQLQQSRLQQADLVKNFIIAGVGLLLVILALLYRQYRQKKKNSDEISGKNDLLQRMVKEKEWLLKEIHHRVKNNLQMVVSLLNSQSAFIENDVALTAIKDSQQRVHAMSLIHQKLHNSDNVSSIDMSFYIRELASYLRDSFNTGSHIRFELSIVPLELEVSQAIPIGLILNEAITNSLKYAFPNNKNGVINITLSNTDANHYLLSISDNGIGMPANLNTKKPGSLGLSLMAGLTGDLEGNFTIENNNGTTIHISFVHNPGGDRPYPLT